MIRRIVIILLVVFLLVPAGLAEEDDDLEITDILEFVPDETGEKLTYDSDGAVIMTITCTGDFTIGGDNYHHKDIFTPELEAHGGDINFTMENVRSILASDNLTIVNFEGTFTDTKYVPEKKKGNDFLFSISPSYIFPVSIMTPSGHSRTIPKPSIFR